MENLDEVLNKFLEMWDGVSSDPDWAHIVIEGVGYATLLRAAYAAKLAGATPEDVQSHMQTYLRRRFIAEADFVAAMGRLAAGRGRKRKAPAEKKAGRSRKPQPGHPQKTEDVRPPVIVRFPAAPVEGKPHA